MVMHEMYEIKVKRQCASCGKRVDPGDMAWLTVALPEGRADTICPSCWTVMLGAAMLWLGQEGSNAQVALDWALEALKAHETAINGPRVRKAPA